MAKLGAQVELITVLADDLPGQVQRDELSAAGIDLSHCRHAKGCTSPQAVILVDAPREERRILWSRSELPGLDPKLMDRAWLDGIDLLYLDSHEPCAGAALAEEARRRSLPIVLDAGNVREGMAELVPLCSDVISSTVFAPRLTGQSEPLAALRAISALGPAHVAMTFGKAGCLALWNNRAKHVPAFVFPVRDTTGAGDVFHAGYAFARAKGRPWLECLEFGSATAALKCRDWGGRRGLPTLAEVESLLREGERRKEEPPRSLG
jgi:sugar/nucleoside kinase (ribokinase family)